MSTVSVWVAVAAWLACWTALAFLSMRLLSKVRPGETVPMRRLADGSPAWGVSPGLAAALTPALATLVGAVTIGVSLYAGSGRAPIMNALLPAIFVYAHWTQVSMAVKLLEKERQGR